jgi:MOSC domain-containing protein YiiM
MEQLDAGRVDGAAPRVLSVNVGPVREVEWRGRLVRTGMWKEPVGARSVAARGVNLEGDDQGDRTVHGGVHKAVYAYAVEDYRHWREVEGIETPVALFGENLTVQGVDLQRALVGERWRVGSTLLEVTQPRFPCFKLGIRLDDAHFPRRFLAVGRLGAYLRIVEPGELRAGDAVERTSGPDGAPTLAEVAEGRLGR